MYYHLSIVTILSIRSQWSCYTVINTNNGYYRHCLLLVSIVTVCVLIGHYNAT